MDDLRGRGVFQQESVGSGGRNMQAHWAVWYYETYGYWTSVNSAIATWAMIAP